MLGDISALRVDMTTRVLGVVGQALLPLPPPTLPPEPVGKDIHRKVSGFFHLMCFKILLPIDL